MPDKQRKRRRPHSDSLNPVCTALQSSPPFVLSTFLFPFPSPPLPAPQKHTLHPPPPPLPPLPARHSEGGKEGREGGDPTQNDFSRLLKPASSSLPSIEIHPATITLGCPHFNSRRKRGGEKRRRIEPKAGKTNKGQAILHYKGITYKKMKWRRRGRDHEK